MKVYRLEVSFSANVKNFDVLTTQVERAVGQDTTDSGFGFGRRDLGFEFTSMQAALAAQAAVGDLHLEDYTSDIV